MKIDQLASKYKILPEVFEVVSLTREVTGKDLDFQLVLNLNTDGSTKIARKRMPEHLIKLKENSTARINHIIVHECGHILRTMSAEASERVVPSSNHETTSRALDDMQDELTDVPPESRLEIGGFWMQAIINQLVNLPVDARIETWIYNDYPSFRVTQGKSIEADVQNSLLSLSDKVRESTAESVFKKSGAMIYAYLRSVSAITGVNYAPHFKKYPDIKKLGRKLYACLEAEDEGFDQDVEIIKRWAEMLGIEGWVTWIGFEDVPESYYEA